MSDEDREMRDRVKRVIVESLRLKVKAEEISDSAPLFPTLGLDSIDGLEMAVALEKEFGVAVTSRDVDKKVFESIDSIVDFLGSAKKS